MDATGKISGRLIPLGQIGQELPFPKSHAAFRPTFTHPGIAKHFTHEKSRLALQCFHVEYQAAASARALSLFQQYPSPRGQILVSFPRLFREAVQDGHDRWIKTLSE